MYLSDKEYIFRSKLKTPFWTYGDSCSASTDPESSSG